MNNHPTVTTETEEKRFTASLPLDLYGLVQSEGVKEARKVAPQIKHIVKQWAQGVKRPNARRKGK